MLDEPSAVLADSEIDQLLTDPPLSTEQGVSFIYIRTGSRRFSRSRQRHRAARRRRRRGGNSRPPETDVDQLMAGLMVGRDVSNVFPSRKPSIGAPVLSVQNLSTTTLLKDVSLDCVAARSSGVRAGRGRALGIAAGDLPRGSAVRRQVLIDGAAGFGAHAAIGASHGLGLLPEDRKTQGLFLGHSVAFNITIAQTRRDIAVPAHLARCRGPGFSDRQAPDRSRSKLPVRESAVREPVRGNQQKCVIGKLLNADCRILLADEPTRGVDVAAKREDLRPPPQAHQVHGMAILFVSSELPEILNLSDRILVMRDGAIAAELTAGEASKEIIMKHATVHRAGSGRMTNQTVLQGQATHDTRDPARSHRPGAEGVRSRSGAGHPVLVRHRWCRRSSSNKINLLNVLRQVSLFGVVAVGMTFVILTRASQPLGRLRSWPWSGCWPRPCWRRNTPIPIAIAAGLAAGTLVGVVNGQQYVKRNQ